jgi:hypothetical protein
MKNLRKLFGIISIIAIIAFAMTACVQPDDQEQTPVADDYVIGNLKQNTDSVTAVTVTPKSGKSGGKVTIYYEGIGDTTYTKSTVVPTGTSGSTYAIYNVTFDVAAATGWTEAKGLFAGLLTIGNPTPVAGDYEISGLWQTFNSVNAVTITPRPGKSPGARTIYYEGTGSTTYTKSATLPSSRGTYAVTFDVAAATIWNPATGLSAGTLEINDKPTPAAGDYDIGGLTQSAGSAAAVTITPKTDKSNGARTIYYAGTTFAKSTTLPTAAGSYAVTFDVAAAGNWNPATGLSAGTLVLNTNQTPVAGDYNISGLFQTFDNTAKTVMITPKEGKSGGPSTIYYEGTGSTTYARSGNGPSAEGTYAVTFDVAAVTGWNPATGLSAGTLEINRKSTPVASDYETTGLSQTMGDVKAVTIKAKTMGNRSPGVPNNIKYAGNAALPTAAGSYPVTFDVPAAGNWNPATGLSAGTLTIAPAGGSNTFTNVGDFDEWLSTQRINTKDTAHTAFLNLSAWDNRIQYALQEESRKYVNLDFSGSTFTSIPIRRAFAYCSNLIGVTLPNSLTSIPDETFSCCYNLTSVTLPNSLTSIPDETFSYCYNLTSITIPNTVTSIGDAAFYYCDSLKSVTIPDSVKSIGYKAFYYCDDLSKVTIGNGVTSIGYNAFERCYLLTAIDVNSANTKYSSEDGVLYNKGKTTLLTYPAGKTTTTGAFTIPNSVESIGYSAFAYCKNLTGVTIPDSVTSIGDAAFAYCENLTEIKVDAGNSEYNSEGGVLYDKYKTLVTYPAGKTTKTFIIPDDVTSIGYYAFAYCEYHLTGVTIPDSVTSIGDMAFAWCYSLISVTFEGTIEENNFDVYAFGYEDDYDNSYIGDLRAKYFAEGPGTYKRGSNYDYYIWTRQP